MNISKMILLMMISGVWVTLQAQSHAAPVRVALVKQEITAKRHVVTGSTRARQRSELACQESGLLTRLLVRSGQEVKKDDIIAELDRRRLQLGLEQAQLAVQRAVAVLNKSKVSLENVQSELKRRQQASEANKGAISAEVLERMRSQVAVSQQEYLINEQDLAVARKQVAYASVRLDDISIRAPFDGVVVSQHVEEGEWVNAGGTIITLTASAAIEVVFEVPEQQVMAEVRQMDALSIFIAGIKDPIIAKTFRVVPDIDPRSRRYQIIAELDNKAGTLAPGMSANCAVAAAEKKEYTLIPDDALMRDAGGAYVYKVGNGLEGVAIAMPVPVKILFMDQRQIAVDTPALKAGDQIVIEGNERLRPMTPLQVLVESEP